VVELFFDCAVCEVGAKELEEVLDAGAGEGCDRAAVGGTEGGCVVEGGQLKLKLFTTCTICAGLQHVLYAPVAISRPSQLCHSRNLQVWARPLTAWIRPLQRVLGVYSPPEEGAMRGGGCVQLRACVGAMCGGAASGCAGFDVVYE
jgi:hypothetical protein